MNEKEVAEIRRRFRPDKSNIANVRGCYVNDKHEIVSEFNQSLSLMPENEAEKFLAIIKRTLSGAVKKNLIDIDFTTEQTMQSEEHHLLMSLKDSVLKDEATVHSFFERIVQALTLKENYLILLTHETYDIPYRSKDGGKFEDASSEVFSYILCSICPIKQTKPALSYSVYENEFHTLGIDWVLAPPEIGFMFPAFDDRSANIYSALYYTRDITQNYEEFVDAVFKTTAPMPAAEQKETFQSVLSATLEDDCSFEVIDAVHGKLKQLIEVHKENKEEQPLTISKNTVKQILKINGVADEHINAFEQQFDSAFGDDAQLSPRNIVDTKQVAVSTPDVKIQVSAGCSDLIETRIIDGAKYIIIRAEEGVELNGVPIHISE